MMPLLDDQNAVVAMRIRHRRYGDMEVLCQRLPCELVRLVTEHGAAMKLQRRVRWRRARHGVRRERKRMRTERELKENECVGKFIGSFAFGSTPMPSALACWVGDVGWYRRYQPKFVARMERVK